MKKKKLLVATDSMCDLPQQIIEQYEIKVIYSRIRTDRGEFYDFVEITSSNMLEYMQRTDSAIETYSPTAKEATGFFNRELKRADEILFISASAQLSNTYEGAVAAARNNPHIHIFNSGQISGGLGIFVLLAATMVQEHKSLQQILDKLESLRHRVSSVALLNNVKYVYDDNFFNKKLLKIMQKLSLHPSFSMVDDCIKLRRLYIGDINKYCRNFVRRQITNNSNISSRIIVIATAGCHYTTIETIRDEINLKHDFDIVITVNFAAVTTSHCGPNTIALFYVSEE